MYLSEESNWEACLGGTTLLLPSRVQNNNSHVRQQWKLPSYTRSTVKCFLQTKGEAVVGNFEVFLSFKCQDFYSLLLMLVSKMLHFKMWVTLLINLHTILFHYICSDLKFLMYAKF